VNDPFYSKKKYVRNALNTQWKIVEDNKCIQAAMYKCPDKYLNDSPAKDKLAEAMFKSFESGFNSGYYLIINAAVGGDGVVKGNKPVANDINETMLIHSVKRFVING